LVIERAAEPTTCSLTVALLFALLGSAVVEETESVCVIVPGAVPVFTFTVNVKFAVVPDAIVVLSVQVSVASTHVHPAGLGNDTAVVPAGSVSVNTGAAAVAGPPLVTLCVYVILFPAVTGFGVAEFVTLRSACVPDATGILNVAVLLVAYVSREVVATVTVSAMIVPAAVPALTVYFAVIVPVDPGGTLGLVQATGDAFGQVHVPPPAVTTATETNVKFAGSGSLKVAVLQLLGPLLVTIWV